jgi:Holliday junction resolvase-like predicted endonuclease
MPVDRLNQKPPAPPDPARVTAFRHGLSAESRAALLLVAKGYRIAARRFKAPVGEIDIVARRRQTLAFVEVKARARYDDAVEAVTAHQQGRIVAAAPLLARVPPWRYHVQHSFRRRAGYAPSLPASHSSGVRRGILSLLKGTAL